MAADSTRPTWAELSRQALAANYQALHRQAAQAGAQIISVIKANAYGHGAIEGFDVLEREGCDWFAVTCLDEARALYPRLHGHRTLVLSGLFAGEAAEVVQHGLTPALGSVAQLAWLTEAVSNCETPPFPLHLEIDTGMARQGIQWHDNAALGAFASRLRDHPQVALEGVMTHFASPEDPHSSQTAEQITRFHAAIRTLREHGCVPRLIHAGNSATVFEGQQTTALAAIAREQGSRLLFRPGIALYGYGPLAAQRGLAPVLSWKTRIAAVRNIVAGEAVSYNATFRATRPTRIALLPVGYADGYNRLLSNKGEVLVRGRRAPIAGRVTMDQIMIDVTDIAEAETGDDAVLLGAQGSERITADDLAAHNGTIAYEVLCAIGQRVPRQWI